MKTKRISKTYDVASKNSFVIYLFILCIIK